MALPACRMPHHAPSSSMRRFSLRERMPTTTRRPSGFAVSPLLGSNWQAIQSRALNAPSIINHHSTESSQCATPRLIYQERSWDSLIQCVAVSCGLERYDPFTHTVLSDVDKKVTGFNPWGQGAPFKAGTADFTSKAVTPHAQTDFSTVYFSQDPFCRM